MKEAPRRVGAQIGTSVLDQGAVSAANFLSSLLLARWLAPADYGAFALAGSLGLFLTGFHEALLVDPMSVFGAGRYHARREGYLRSLVRLHGAASVAMATALLAGAWLLARRGHPSAGPLAAVAVALPFMLLFVLVRRMFYLVARPAAALRASALYLVLLLGGLWWLDRAGASSAVRAFGMMGAAAALAGGAGLATLGLYGRRAGRDLRAVPLAELLGRHWTYGRWIVAANVSYWLSAPVYVPLLTATHGLAAAGAFRAYQNLLLPLQQLNAAVIILMIPWMAREASRRGPPDPRRLAPLLRHTLIANAATGALYALALLAFGPALVRLAYGDGPYLAYTWLLPWCAGLAFIGGAWPGFAAAFRALERSRAIFESKSAGAAATLLVGVAAAHAFGLPGAMAGLIAALACETAVLTVRWVRPEGAGS